MFILMFQLDRMIFCGGRGGSRILGGRRGFFGIELGDCSMAAMEAIDVLEASLDACLPFFWGGGAG